MWRLRAVATIVALAAGAAAAPARAAQPIPETPWHSCEDGLRCATVPVPRDYSRPDGPTFDLALIRAPATDTEHRLGSLFINPGGPGLPGVALVAGLHRDGFLSTGPFADLNRRFDLVGFDPRGVGLSRPSVQCLTDEEARAQFSAPLPRPDNLDVDALTAWAQRWVDRCVARNHGVLPYVSTGNVARDLDRLREVVGDPRLTYLGLSYGTLLGATYAALFPSRVRALALDGAVDPDTWLLRPLEATREEAAGFERALSRFLACAGRSPLCAFTADDPEVAFDGLVDRLDRAPIAGRSGDPRPVVGDTVLEAAAVALYDRNAWPLLATDLKLAGEGMGGGLQELADLQWGISSDGVYDHQADRFLAIAALDQRHPRALAPYLDAGRDNFVLFPHFWWGSGYSDLPWGLLRTKRNGVVPGPFRLSPEAPTALVIGTTYDPATPYAWARRLTVQLGNARLLTMIGDGHTAFGGNSTCIDTAVVAYVETLTLPAPGLACRQRTRLAGVQARTAQWRSLLTGRPLPVPTS